MQKEIIYHNTLPITIIRSKRRKKTLFLKVIHNETQIHIPHRYSRFALEQFIQSKIVWIKKQIKQQKENVVLLTKQYENGESFLYLGEVYQLQIEQNNNKIFPSIQGHYLIVTISETHDSKRSKSIQKLLIAWYKQKALQLFTQRTDEYATQIKVRYTSLRVKNYKARWGSCSFSDHISYNWRLIMAPDFVINYVVVHELCHILEHNHSKYFWEHVEKAFGEHKQAKAWLKKHILELYSI